MEEFKDIVWGYYRRHKRSLPWRDEPFDQYRILVSEIMLQQTQVQRVIPKYETFIHKFPTVRSLANAQLSDVLIVWSGLGYNRRAKYLHEAAKKLYPKNTWAIDDLMECKGVGQNTAAAVIVYSQNVPIAFIETNIRTVYIHHFFTGQENISDKQLLPLIRESIDTESPREWYWALMDYGTYLKKTVGNVSRQSKHYAKQPKFHGSIRQLRGEVLRVLAKQPQSEAKLAKLINDDRLLRAVNSLEQDGLIHYRNKRYSLAS